MFFVTKEFLQLIPKANRMKTILLVTDGKANDRRSVFIVARTSAYCS